MRRRVIALALLLWYVPACTSWQIARGITPQQLIADKHPTKVRLSLAGNSEVVLEEPRVAGDSLAGFVNGKDSSVLAADVTQLAIRKVSGGRTVGLVVGLGLVAAAIALGAALQNMCILSCVTN